MQQQIVGLAGLPQRFHEAFLVEQPAGQRLQQAPRVGGVEQQLAGFAVAPPAAPHPLNELLARDWLEALGPELIVGVEGEFVVNGRDFYSMFRSEPALKVFYAGKTVGEIPYSPTVQEQENLLLAARTWKIKEVDFAAKRIEVVPANDGKKPLFFGGGGTVHPRIREKMLHLLASDSQHSELDAASQEALRVLRRTFAGFGLPAVPTHERPVLAKSGGEVKLYTFAGTRVNRGLALLLEAAEVAFSTDERESSFTLAVAPALLPALFAQLRLFADDVDFHIAQALTATPGLIDFAKWGAALPRPLQVAVLKERYYDVAGTITFLRETRMMLAGG